MTTESPAIPNLKQEGLGIINNLYGATRLSGLNADQHEMLKKQAEHLAQLINEHFPEPDDGSEQSDSGDS